MVQKMSAEKRTTFRERYGPWALVAGASEGLGAEFATQLAAKGLHLVLVARRQELLERVGARLMREYDIEVRTLPLDLGREDAGSVLETATGDIEIGLLVYNAAVSMIGQYFEISLENHLGELAVNCRGPLVLSYLLGQHMVKRRRGGVVLMSSLSSSQGSALITNYSATKAYNRLLAEGLWDELRTQGVDVLACAASSVSTPGYQASAPRQSRFSVAAMPPREVVSETLAALGKKPVVVPGWSNRLANVVMQHLMPHNLTIKIMGTVTRNMYQRS